MILVIDDNREMAECIAKATGRKCVILSNAIDAMNRIVAGEEFEMIIMEVLITGPDGFSFLNEMVSYADTAKIPVLIVTDRKLRGADLAEYGVVGVLDKETMVPRDIRRYVERYA